MNYIILSVLVIAWCVLHSAMISISVIDYLQNQLGSKFRFYRLFYNLISIFTIIPVVQYAYSIQTQVIFNWDGYLRIGQLIILMLAILLFLLGGRHYNLLQVMGIKQIVDGTSHKTITDTGELDTSGLLGITRHPWYLAALLIIWAREMDVSAIIVNLILSLYLVVGTYLEEKKLIKEFGNYYLNYREKVSMLIPFKWLKSRLIK